MDDGKAYFAGTDAQIALVVRALGRAADRGEAAGLDTEFYGLDIRRQSTVATAQLHLLSVAVRRYPPVLHPRGYHVADAAVFLRPTLEHPGLARWLESGSPKAVHNLPVDAHTLANAGVSLGGGINTLAMARWAWPGRARGRGFTLDSLAEDLLGAGKTESYQDIFRQESTVWSERTRVVSGCECGEVPRRGHPRSTTPGHQRYRRPETSRVAKTVMVPVPLQEVIPGHRLWERALAYSARDALLALYIHELSGAEMARTNREMPW